MQQIEGEDCVALTTFYVQVACPESIELFWLTATPGARPSPAVQCM